MEADLAILDEIDSGLDIDALRDVATAVNGLRKPERGLLLITHYQRLLEYITPQFVHIMVPTFFHFKWLVSCLFVMLKRVRCFGRKMAE